MGLTRFIIGFIILYIAFSFLGMRWSIHKKHEFSLRELVDLVASSQSNTTLEQQTYSRSMYQKLIKNHDKILTEESFPPLLRSIGGIHGSIQLLYGSVTEILAIHHAPLKTGGDTGRHFMNITVSVLQGDVTIWREKKQKVEKHSAGKTFLLRVGERTFVEIGQDTYLLIYGRGLVPMTMGYWVSDDLFSSVDPLSAGATITYYFRAVYESSAPVEFFHSLYNSAWLLASKGISYAFSFFDK